MAESTLSLTIGELRKEVSFYLGYGRDAAILPEAQSGLVDDIVIRGLRKFYYPPIDKGYEAWSFMRPTVTLETMRGEWEYTLPDAFGGIIGVVTFDVTEGYVALKIISEAQIRQMRQTRTSTSQPQYAAVTLDKADGTGTRWKMQLWPTPNKGTGDDDGYHLTYKYTVIPERLGDGDNDYPLGGAPHGETVLASCLAVAEEMMNDEVSTKRNDFERSLVASIAYDRRSNTPETLGYNRDLSDERAGRRSRYWRAGEDIRVTYNGIEYP